MLDTLFSLLAIAGIGLSAYGVGRPTYRLLRLEIEDRLSIAIWSIALGLATVGMILTGLGLAGWLSVPAIRFATVVAALYGVSQVLRSIASKKLNQAEFPTGDREIQNPAVSSSPLLRGSCPSPPHWLLIIAFALAAISSFAALLGALAPAVAGDALCYHLELPKVFLARGAIVHLPFHDNATFPLLTEMWYLWALALDSAVTAQLVHWGLGLLLGFSAVLLASQFVGRSWAWIGGCLVMAVPGITNQMAAPLNDVALAVFTTLSLIAWRRAMEDGRFRWFIVAGLMLGAALGIKYVALLFLAAVGVTQCWTFLREPARRSRMLRGSAVTMLLAALVSGVWYVRAAQHRGNPVYPFFAETFGSDGPQAMPESKTPLKWSVVDFVTSPWQVTMAPQRFGGRGHQLGALFLMILPALFFTSRIRRLAPLLAIAAVYWIMWYAMRQNVRFLFPLIPLLSAAVLCVAVDLARWPKLPRSVAASVCGAVILMTTLAPAYRARRHVAVAVGWESREQFLLQREPTYRAALFVNRRLPAEARILSQDYRGFYFQRDVTRENVFRRVTAYQHRLGASSEFVATLRKAGFSHVLLAQAKGQGIRYNDTLSRLANAAQASEPGLLATLLAYEFRDDDGTLRRYRLLELRGEP